MSIFSLETQKKNLNGVEAESTSGSFEQDPRLWTIKEKIGSARVRFLPFFDGERAIPYVCILQIGANRVVNGKKKYLIEKSLSSIGQTCPLKEAYDFLKSEADKGNEVAKELIASGFKLTKKYFSNVLVKVDSEGGTSSGKIKIFQYGVTLKNILESFALPSKSQLAAGQAPRDVFDPLNGYDMVINKTLNINGIPTWEQSTVANGEKGPFSDKCTTVEQYAELCKSGKIYDIRELKDVSQFKTYEQLKNKIAAFYPGLERNVLQTDTAYVAPVTPAASSVSPATQSQNVNVVPPTTDEPSVGKQLKLDLDENWLD